MADRTSAEIYRSIFRRLAEDPEAPKHRAWALAFWRESHAHDFSPDQMGCDDALVALGLAQRVLVTRANWTADETFYADRNGEIRVTP